MEIHTSTVEYIKLKERASDGYFHFVWGTTEFSDDGMTF